MAAVASLGELSRGFRIAISHCVAMASALFRSVKYSRVLGIRGEEWRRYLKKSASLALCYTAFGTRRRYREARLAGDAAFLCCAYDVVTDWRMFAPQDRATFESILRALVKNTDTCRLALDLYDKEHSGRLVNDGLERGPIALRFTLQLMECEETREIEWRNVDDIGELLQIVDDVLDYEEDLASGDVNCLTTDRRQKHLARVVDRFSEVNAVRLFGDNGPVLLRVIRAATEKADRMLRESPSSV